MDKSKKKYVVVVWYGEQVGVVYDDLYLPAAMLKADTSFRVMDATGVEILEAD